MWCAVSVVDQVLVSLGFSCDLTDTNAGLPFHCPLFSIRRISNIKGHLQLTIDPSGTFTIHTIILTLWVCGLISVLPGFQEHCDDKWMGEVDWTRGWKKKKSRHNEMPMHQNHLLETALKTIKHIKNIKTLLSLKMRQVSWLRTHRKVVSSQPTRDIATLLLHRSS